MADNEWTIPEISVQELAERLKSDASLILLDVREPFELNYARLDDPRVCLAPMSQLANFGTAALPEAAQDPAAELVVFCHLGMRSAEVTAWLQAQGWQSVRSLAGGLDQYSRLIDPQIGRY